MMSNQASPLLSEQLDAAIKQLIVENSTFSQHYEVLDLMGVWTICDRTTGKVLAGKRKDHQYFIRLAADYALAWKLAVAFARLGLAPSHSSMSQNKHEWILAKTTMPVCCSALSKLWRYWRQGGTLRLFLNQQWQTIADLAIAQEMVFVQSTSGEEGFMALSDFAFWVPLDPITCPN